MAARVAAAGEDYESLFPGDPRSSGIGGIVGLERLIRMRRSNPEIVIGAAEAQLWNELGLMPQHPASWLHWAQEDLVPQVSSYVTLSRCLVLVAGVIDEGRLRGLKAQHALLIHIMRGLEDACYREGHDMGPA